MDKQIFELGYGRSKLVGEIPVKGYLGVLRPMATQVVGDVEAGVLDALRHPVGSATLGEIVRVGEEVAIIVSDVTRGIPSSLLLPPLLDELNRVGVADDKIFIVVAYGHHRRHTDQENEMVIDKRILERVRVVHHDAYYKGNLSHLGTTSHGVPVFINSDVVRADRVILTGGIFFHLMAGFSGGIKSICPGVAGLETILASHRHCLSSNPSERFNPGVGTTKLSGNPMHEIIREAAAMVKPDFLINIIADENKQITRIVAGHYLEAWHEGCQTFEKLNTVHLDRKADLVIASSGGYPRDISLEQSLKGLDNVSYAVRTGGAIIYAAECSDGVGTKEFVSALTLPAIQDVEKDLRRHFTVEGYIGLRLRSILEQSTIILVSGLDDGLVRELGITPAADLDTAMHIAYERIGRDAETLLMPSAPATFPRVNSFVVGG